ncbi:hypothetical protein HDU85_000038 [Gaertneriomyces sp. JEL0708]|nr:hypothetical protein HDU85_000038 [Gaertneriomyces sp. JEL0708]
MLTAHKKPVLFVKDPKGTLLQKGIREVSLGNRTRRRAEDNHEMTMSDPSVENKTDPAFPRDAFQFLPLLSLTLQKLQWASKDGTLKAEDAMRSPDVRQLLAKIQGAQRIINGMSGIHVHEDQQQKMLKGYMAQLAEERSHPLFNAVGTDDEMDVDAEATVKEVDA